MAIENSTIGLPNGDAERVRRDTANGEKWEIVSQAAKDGTIIEPHPLADYELSDYVESSPGISYQGYLRRDGYWAIKQITDSSSPVTIRWAAGTSGYSTNWTGRAGLTYDYFSEVF